MMDKDLRLAVTCFAIVGVATGFLSGYLLGNQRTIPEVIWSASALALFEGLSISALYTGRSGGIRLIAATWAGVAVGVATHIGFR